MRKTRITQWITAVLVAVLLIGVQGLFTNVILVEKAPVMVYAPEDMKSAFTELLKNASMSSEYKIVITNDESNADISVAYAMENDPQYTKFAFSPFVVGYNTDKDAFKKLKEAETLLPNEFNKDYFEIDLLKVINTVINNGEWTNLGIEDNGKINLFYPDRSTIYWHDFYNFMLLVINGGTYPETDSEMKNAVSTMNTFEASIYTEAVSNLEEKIVKTNGFSINSLYILPEKTLLKLSSDKGENVRLFYPFITSDFNYYYIGRTEIGKNLLSQVSSNFYSKLISSDYRSTEKQLSNDYRSVYDARNVYASKEIPKENFFTIDNTEN